ncbi:dienelactone hydrolase family protein [Mitsuaria sp. WAJ17]|uniref:dienelactone hydrolase family protein n=1 Tax=Mitsuaria sp. WAJ17 TaxID=2761452 RepID=UPI002103F079|nr:dienelactone hydrolase family protein [Mitsuaria sp. WAJ17]
MDETAPTFQHVVIGPNGQDGWLTLPRPARALVLFAHGSGSTRHSVRNRSVARTLHGEGFGTLLFDLLEPQEAADRAKVFDIRLLTQRLVDAIRWIDRRPALASLPWALFGSCTGAAAALSAAAAQPFRVYAVVSRGGRTDLAGEALQRIKAPTLLIVGALDTEVLQLNRQAMLQLPALKELVIVPGATHLFAEPGAMAQVAEHAARWLSLQLPAVTVGGLHA